MNPEAESSPDILDIVAPQAVLDPVFIAGLILLGLLVAAALAIALSRLTRELRASRAQRRQEQRPHELAAQALDELESRIDDLSPNEFMLQTSNVVKRYLLDRYHDPVLFETPDEYLERDNLEKAMPSSKRRAVGDFLTGCEIIKFSRFPEAHAQCPPLLDSARKIIRESPSPSPADTSSASPQATAVHG
jgi:hypothetical protein